VEPLIQAMVPTGAGGIWSKMLMESPLLGGTKPLVAAVIGAPESNLSHLHPGMFLLQTSWEVADQLASAPYVAARPLPGQAPRSIYEPVGPEDEYFSPEVYNAVAMGFGNQQVGADVWDSMQDALALVGQGGKASYPVQHNRTSADGDDYTGVVVQYPEDGILTGHYIAFQLDEVKYQYGCFLATHAQSGTAVVPAPAALGTPCE